MAEKMNLDPKLDPDLLFVPYLYCSEIIGKNEGLMVFKFLKFNDFCSKDLEKLKEYLSKRKEDFPYDEYFEVLLTIQRIKKKFSLQNLSTKNMNEYLYYRSWLRLKFTDQTYLWNYQKNEKLIVLPLNLQIIQNSSFEQEKFRH